MGYYLNDTYMIGNIYVYFVKSSICYYQKKFSSYVGDAGNTSLVDAGTPLGATAVVTAGSVGYLLWECCILASL